MAFRGKIVLVVAAGGHGKQFIWNVCKEYGIQVCLVDFDASSPASSEVPYFIGYDYRNHKEDEMHAINIIKILREKMLNIDGCVTFWDDCGPLTAIICHMLSLQGTGKHAALVVKTKSLTHDVLRNKMRDSMTNSDTFKLSTKCFPINGLSDIDNALKFVGAPAVLKLEHGVSSYGVKIVKDSRKCKEVYQTMQSDFTREKERTGTGLGHGADFMLMEFIDGTHHSVDIVLFQGEMILAVVSDYLCKETSRFIFTAFTMPTCLPPYHENQLITAARQCCNRIGFVNGVLDVEFKMTLEGPKLIEINGRMGGHNVRDMIHHCFGIDLVVCVFMVGLGIRPEIIQSVAKCQMMGVYCGLHAHKAQMQQENTLSSLNKMIQEGIIQYTQLISPLDDSGNHGEETLFCTISVTDSNIAKAKDKLINVCEVLGLNINGYDFNQILNCFDDK